MISITTPPMATISRGQRRAFAQQHQGVERIGAHGPVGQGLGRRPDLGQAVSSLHQQQTLVPLGVFLQPRQIGDGGRNIGQTGGGGLF